MAVDLDIVRELVKTKPQSRLSGDAPKGQITHASQLAMAWRIDWEERAAILQYNPGRTRNEAEREALQEIVDQLQLGMTDTRDLSGR